MRLPFLLATLSLPLLALLAACGGDGGGGPEEGPLIQDAEAVVLQTDDVLPTFKVAPGSALHVTNEQACATAPTDEEKQQCVQQLDGWGRKDHYQIAYVPLDEEAILTSVYYAFSGVSIYETAEGAAQAYSDSREELQQTIRESTGISTASPATVGDESTAFVVSGTQTFGGRDIPTSAYVLDFRRRNTIVRVQMNIATALRTDEDNLAEIARLAKRVDAHILQAAAQTSPTAAPTATATAAP